VSGAVPWVVGVVAAVTLLGSLAGRREGWPRRMLLEAGAAAAVTAAAQVALRRAGLLRWHFPPSFSLWVGLVVFTAAMAAGEWQRTRCWHRAVSLLSVAAAAALAGVLINLHYAYYPTLASVLGQRAMDEATPRQLSRALVDAEATRRLPSRGQVVPTDFPAIASGFHARPGLVYLPPAWFAQPRPQLPAILMLAGSPGQPADWTRGGGADQAADRFAAAHGGYAPILVLADQNGSVLADTECVDGPLHRPDTYLAVDVRQYVIRTYGASPDPARWGVAGLSEGGTCALTLTLRHPDLFSAVGDFSGELAPSLSGRADTLTRLFGGSPLTQRAYDPLTLLARQRFPGVAVWFEAGAADLRAGLATRSLAAAARTAGIDTHLGTERGGHAFAFWNRAFNDALPWLAGHMGLGVLPPATSELTLPASPPATPPGDVGGDRRPPLTGAGPSRAHRGASGRAPGGRTGAASGRSSRPGAGIRRTSRSPLR